VSVALQGRLKATAAEGVREAVIGDMGLTVSSEWNFSPELRSGRGIEILQDWALPATNLSAVFPSGRLASTKARAFVAFVEQLMGGLNPVSPERECASIKSVQTEVQRELQHARRAALVADR
jgi:DNA-binding transcriptional LysR family regulator